MRRNKFSITKRWLKKIVTIALNVFYAKKDKYDKKYIIKIKIKYIIKNNKYILLMIQIIIQIVKLLF